MNDGFQNGGPFGMADPNLLFQLSETDWKKTTSMMTNDSHVCFSCCAARVYDLYTMYWNTTAQGEDRKSAPTSRAAAGSGRE